MAAFELDLSDQAFRQSWENPVILTPRRAERCLPFDIRRNAVAVANMDCGGAGETGGGAMKRLDAPVRCGVHVHIEGRLVALDHIDAVSVDRPGLLDEGVPAREF